VDQLDESVLRVEVLSAVGNVVSCEQNLSDWLSSVHEQLIPQTHELALSNGSQGLDLRKVFRSAFHVHVAQSDANGAGGDNDYAMPIFLEFAGGFDDGREN